MLLSGIKKPCRFHDKVFYICRDRACTVSNMSYFFFLFCSSFEIDSRIEVSAMMFLYFM